MAQKREEKEEVVWTPDMPDRRLNDRRDGLERRQTVGQAMHIPTPRHNGERRNTERRRVTLTITGRALHGGFSERQEDEDRV